eukprot:CAMPEP_0179074224 /NCGR_PEP_ID=MMETSP0796-20121207/32977_1 /TAXON_ID=73915 /ORGANISM="Pyrodinium bahamense, Strain pbaha01" /LENGTH=43 /DNA_ID= /DNA_START= /DNA_END= /DNA_ORIENTATION=
MTAQFPPWMKCQAAITKTKMGPSRHHPTLVWFFTASAAALIFS